MSRPKMFSVIFQRMDKDEKLVQAEYMVECENETTASMMAIFNISRHRKEDDWLIKSIKPVSGD